MPHRWIDHTAELGLQLDCRTEPAVFEAALAAFADLLDDGRAHDEAGFNVTIQAPDRATLLAEWLDELVFRAETEHLVPERVERLCLDVGGLRARVIAHRGWPRHFVKGVTYHRLSFERTNGGYRATMVVDV